RTRRRRSHQGQSPADQPHHLDAFSGGTNGRSGPLSRTGRLDLFDQARPAIGFARCRHDSFGQERSPENFRPAAPPAPEQAPFAHSPDGGSPGQPAAGGEVAGKVGTSRDDRRKWTKGSRRFGKRTL